MWHRRETRRQTEKTNLNLRYLEKLVYSTQFLSIEVLHMQTESLRMFGEGKFNWSVVGVGYPRQYTLGAMAIGMLGHVRVGMEDNLYVRPGQLCKSKG